MIQETKAVGGYLAEISKTNQKRETTSEHFLQKIDHRSKNI